MIYNFIISVLTALLYFLFIQLGVIDWFLAALGTLVSEYLATPGGIVLLTLAISELVSRYTKANGFPAQLQSWAVAIVLCTLGTYTNLGVFSDEGKFVWYVEGPISGFFIGLAANGLFQVPKIIPILETLKIREKKK